MRFADRRSVRAHQVDVTGRSGARRVVTGLAISLVMGAILPVVPAVAAGTNQLMFPDGSTSIAVGANAAIRIDGRLTYEIACPTGGLRDFIYPATDVYLIRSDDPQFPTLRDVSGVPNTIVSTQSVFLSEIIGITKPSGTLGTGVYDIVYDTCQNGVFDPAADDRYEAAVTVTVPSIFRDAPTSPLKVQANAQAEHWIEMHDSLEAAFAGMDAIALLAEVGKSAKDGLAEALKELALGIADSTVPVEAVGGKELPPDLYADMLDYVKERALQLTTEQLAHYTAIVADPPDPGFRTHPSVAVSAVTGVFATDSEIHNALVDTLAPAAAEAEITEALLHAVERYQGAQAAGERTWALVQARAAADLAGLLVEVLPTTASSLRGFHDELAPVATDLDAAFSVAHDFQMRVGSSGFSADERRALLNRGISPVAIARLESAVRAAAATPRQISERLMADASGLADTIDAAVSTYQASEEGWRRLADELALNTSSPLAEPGGPYVVGEGETLTLDGSSSHGTVGSPVARYTWDLDADGSFDDATTATPTFERSTEDLQIVGLRVETEDGNAAHGYTTVSVTPRDDLPRVSAVAPSSPSIEAEVGTSIVFELDAVDPDGGTLSRSWKLDGVDLSTGASFTYEPSHDDVGHHVVGVRVSDTTGGGSVVRTWDVLITLPDGDGDGWTPTTDCDDADAAISPGGNELLGNGIDDDCDEGTPDAPPGGLTGSIWTWGSNALGALGLGSGASATGVPVPLPGYDDVVQVISQFRGGMALRASGEVIAWGENYDGQLGRGTYSSGEPDPEPVLAIGGGPGRLSSIRQIATASGHVLGLRVDGGVVAWGSNRNLQLGDGSTVASRSYPTTVLSGPDGEPLTGVSAVEVGAGSSFALMGDGTVREWGVSRCRGATVEQPYPITVSSAGSDVRQISSGGNWVVLLRKDGTVLTCGAASSSAYGRIVDSQHPSSAAFPVIGMGPGSSVIDVSAGTAAAAALRSDGSVWAWGQNVNGELSPILPVGSSTRTPLEIPLPPGPPVVDVEFGSYHVLATRADGSMLAWGTDTNGVTGTGTAAAVVDTPTVVPFPGLHVIGTGASSWNSLALTRPVDGEDWDQPATWISVSIGDVTVPEGGSAGFELTLSSPAPDDITVAWELAPGTAGSGDLTTTSGSTTIPRGSTSSTVPLSVTDDPIDEDDETFSLVLGSSSNGVRVGDGVGAGVVLDDDAPPRLTIDDLEILEGNTALTDVTVPVMLEVPAEKDVTVTVSTGDLSARSPGDYEPKVERITIPAGRTRMDVHLVVRGDQEVERSETLFVELSDPTNAGLADPEAIVRIVDDDVLFLHVEAPTTLEGSGATQAASFVVELAPDLPADATVTIPYRIEGLTAAAPDDVDASTGELTFTADHPRGIVDAAVVPDLVDEPDELYRLVLGEASVGSPWPILPAEAPLAVIVDDDETAVPPTIDAGLAVSGSEGGLVTVEGVIEDPDSNPTVEWSWSAGGDVDPGGRCTFTDPGAPSTRVSCDDDGTFILTLTADDGPTGMVSDSTTLTLSNEAPVITLQTVQMTGGGAAVTIGFEDEGTNDAHRCEVDWGDGSPRSVLETVSPCNVVHPYAALPATASIRVIDDDGGVSETSLQIGRYAFRGFFPPVDNLPIVNRMRGGRAVPVKFSLGGDRGLDIFATGFPRVASMACTGEQTDAIEETVAAGGSVLQYDPATDLYTYVWKTQQSWAGTCRELIVRLADGTEKRAHFRFT